MTRKETRIKKWWEENKTKVKKDAVKVGWLTLGIGAGYFVGSKITGIGIGFGIERAHNSGIIKFFDPATNLEVDAEEAVNVLKRHMK